MITSSTPFHEVKRFTQVYTEPALEPVTVDEVMDQANIDVHDQPELLQGYITAARIMVEKDVARSLMTQTIKLRMDEFPGFEIMLERPPVQSVSSITYVDTDGTTQTLSSSLYETDLSSEPARVRPAYGRVWPFTRYMSNAVTVTYVAGYSSAADVPQTAKLAIKLLASHWYRNREAVGQAGDEVAFAYTALINRLKWRDYA